jgi:hypothetical protein
MIGNQLLLPERSDGIKLGPLVTVSDAPFRFDPPLSLKPMQRGVERSGLDPQHFARFCSNCLGDPVAVHRTPLIAVSAYLECPATFLFCFRSHVCRSWCRQPTPKIRRVSTSYCRCLFANPGNGCVEGGRDLTQDPQSGHCWKSCKPEGPESRR